MDDDLFSAFTAPSMPVRESKPGKRAKEHGATVCKSASDNSKRPVEEDSDETGGNIPKKSKGKNISDGKKNIVPVSDVKLSEKLDKVKKSSDILDDINPQDFESRIKIHVVETIEACLHEVTVPPDYDYKPCVQKQGPDYKPAQEYPFLLDPFQKEAILCLENNQSVLVSAHTSAGKTVVAEYAIAMSLRDKQRVIYTTPIKALSNQKYREFSTEFKDVGLMTGDVTINPSAGCLIMTTEILRSMLYRGSEMMREVAWVIFDEIHYMRDKERGVVWEETIILLPDTIHYVFLSATIPNATQFAQWICHLHQQPCHVVYTDFRPVPLQQYIYPSGASGIYLVANESGNFLESNFSAAMDALQMMTNAKSSSPRLRRTSVKTDNSCYRAVKMIMELGYAPAIIFSFSKKECETYAIMMSKLDLNTPEEKTMVDTVFWSAMDVLSPQDKKLPQVENVLPLLRRGIGIHHSGLLPILKETIEILFSEGLIKALFATETFAMGLNMPARTVLFTNVRKFDGKDFRWITSGEYIQMSGRAGRRGLDDNGIVIMMVDEKISPSSAKNIVKGLPDPINSAFHLTYNMVLNLLRVDEINPEFMLERSFFQFQNYSAIPQLYEELKKLKEQHDSIVIPNEDDVDSYCCIKKTLSDIDDQIHRYIINPIYCVGFFRCGRLIRVQDSKFGDFGWCMVVNYHSKTKGTKTDSGEDTYVIDALIPVSKEIGDSAVSTDVKPPSKGETGEMKIVPISLNMIRAISKVLCTYPDDLRPLENRMTVLDTINRIKANFSDGIPTLHPVKDMQIHDKDLKELIKKKDAFEQRLRNHQLKNDPQMDKIERLYNKKQEVEVKMKEVKTKLKESRALVKMSELKCRKRVLRRMGFCTSADVIETKGRVACEISSADELLLTEMIFSGAFNDLDVHQTSALLSCFVFEEKSNEMPKLGEELSGPLRLMQEMARRIAKISNECRIEIETKSYVSRFRPNLMDVVHAWSKGSTFAEICKMTDVFEGSIIRSLRRLEELMRQMCQAAKAIGNSELENKFSECIKCIKRDIAFAASLYL